MRLGYLKIQADLYAGGILDLQVVPRNGRRHVDWGKHAARIAVGRASVIW